jgi:hypothetical protein
VTAGFSTVEESGKVATGEAPDEIEIALEKVHLRQTLKFNPGDLFKDARVRITGEVRNREEKQMDVAASRVFVLVAGQFGTDVCFYLEFLLQLAFKCSLGRFAVFDLAPRELPLVRVAIFFTPLADQNAPITVDNARGDKKRATVFHGGYLGRTGGR